VVSVIRLVFVLAALAGAPASAAVSVVVSPGTVSLPANGAQQFKAQVFNSTNPNVRWEVNGVPGGAPSIGVISDAGLYTAPSDAPSVLSVTVEAEPAAAPDSPGVAKVGVAAGMKSGPSYYISPTGKNAGSGTQSSPWATFAYALAHLPAGAQLLVEGDASHPYHQLVTINRSGSPTAGFLTIEAAPGAHPVIDGTGQPILGGENGLVTISNASWVRVKGLELQNYKSSTKETPVGIYVEGQGDHIEILNNKIHDIETSLTTTSADALGIYVAGTAKPSINWLTIDGNELCNLILGFSESLSLSGNVELWQVTNNVVHDNNNIGINIEGFFNTDMADPELDQARRGLVAGNVVYNITTGKNISYGDSLGADGLYVDGGTLVTLQNNLVYNSDYGIELASENANRNTSWVWAHDNIVYNSNLSGITIGGQYPKIHDGTIDCFVTNNTFYLDDVTNSGSGEIQVQFYATNNVFDNNILFANAQGLFLNDPGAGAPASLDHNLYFSPGDTSGTPWIWEGNMNITNLSQFQAASGQDKHSKVANPEFVGAAAHNFAIPSTSPAVARGEIVSLSNNGLVDYSGKPRIFSGTIDAGALQH